MNILLINDNPVVSRLLALCTRDDNYRLEEVKDVQNIALGQYDIVFVDEGSYRDEVLRLSEILQIGTKVFLSPVYVETNDFDMTIQKPFLPSQILEVLSKGKQPEVFTDKYAKTDENELESDEEAIFTTQVLNVEELEKIKALLESDDEIQESEEILSEEELEARKIQAIKDQLISEGLEIVEEDKIVDEFDFKDKSVIFPDDKMVPSAKHKKKKDIVLTQDELERIEDAMQEALKALKPKKMKKLLKGKEVTIRLMLKDSE